MQNGILILSGYNIRAVVAFCRWARKKGVPFHLVARNESDPVFLTNYRDAVVLTRENESLNLEDFSKWIQFICQKYSYEKVLLLPSTEFLNRFMLSNLTAIELNGGIVPLVSKELYEKISDKYSFGQLCLSYGIPVPDEQKYRPETFPFVAKPRSYASIQKRQLKPYLIFTPKDLADFKQNEVESEYYFQEYIDGRSLYLLAHIPKQGTPVLFSQENLMQQSNGGSIVLASRSDLHNQLDIAVYVEMLNSIDFHGLIMLELRLDKESNKYYMIEANPRLWGPLQLIVDNDVDILGSFLRDYGFDVNILSNNDCDGKFYFWSGGLNDQEDVVYHNFNPEKFVDKFSSIISNNLFIREDTFDLFRQEL